MASDLVLGHEGAGNNCFDKAVQYSGKGLVAGGFFGAVEACFLPQQPRSTTPLLYTALRNIGGRGLLGGTVLATFAAVTCLTSKYRDKDDFWNPFVGGTIAGSYFGIIARSVPLTIGVGLGTGVTIAIIKYRHNTYFPPLPQKWATLQYKDTVWENRDNN